MISAGDDGSSFPRIARRPPAAPLDSRGKPYLINRPRGGWSTPRGRSFHRAYIPRRRVLFLPLRQTNVGRAGRAAVKWRDRRPKTKRPPSCPGGRSAFGVCATVAQTFTPRRARPLSPASHRRSRP